MIKNNYKNCYLASLEMKDISDYLETLYQKKENKNISIDREIDEYFNQFLVLKHSLQAIVPKSIKIEIKDYNNAYQLAMRFYEIDNITKQLIEKKKKANFKEKQALDLEINKLDTEFLIIKHFLQSLNYKTIKI